MYFKENQGKFHPNIQSAALLPSTQNNHLQFILHRHYSSWETNGAIYQTKICEFRSVFVFDALWIDGQYFVFFLIDINKWKYWVKRIPKWKDWQNVVQSFEPNVSVQICTAFRIICLPSDLVGNAQNIDKMDSIEDAQVCFVQTQNWICCSDNFVIFWWNNSIFNLKSTASKLVSKSLKTNTINKVFNKCNSCNFEQLFYSFLVDLWVLNKTNNTSSKQRYLEGFILS